MRPGNSLNFTAGEPALVNKAITLYAPWKKSPLPRISQGSFLEKNAPEFPKEPCLAIIKNFHFGLPDLNPMEIDFARK